MKATKIVSENTITEQIDWNKPQWFIDEGGDIFLSTGEHNKFSFTATCLPCKDYHNGDYSKDWAKSKFKPLTKPLTIIIEN